MPLSAIFRPQWVGRKTFNTTPMYAAGFLPSVLVNIFSKPNAILTRGEYDRDMMLQTETHGVRFVGTSAQRI